MTNHSSDHPDTVSFNDQPQLLITEFMCVLLFTTSTLSLKLSKTVKCGGSPVIQTLGKWGHDGPKPEATQCDPVSETKANTSDTGARRHQRPIPCLPAAHSSFQSGPCAPDTNLFNSHQRSGPHVLCLVTRRKRSKAYLLPFQPLAVFSIRLLRFGMSWQSLWGLHTNKSNHFTVKRA